MGDARSRFARSVAGYAELVRVPNLFTAPPDVLLGAALAAATGPGVTPGGVAGLALASMLLYAAGTTLNDAFDADVDAVERPERPIPSGRVARRTGYALGGALLVSGVAVAGDAAGVVGGVVAASVAGGIVLYDGVLKGGVAGFAAMGAVRGLNVLLGTTAGESPTPSLAAAGVALAVTAYIAAVTFMASRETESGGRRTVLVAGSGAVVAAAVLLVRLAVARPSPLDGAASLVLGVGFLAWTGRALGRAYRNPVPETIGPAVGTCVLALAVLDAAFAATVDAAWSLVILLFLVPAVGLKQWFSVT
ncbi:UbiA family prenyltransferase [Halorussus aquaticus]|uniref:UbiA family prenyltransferase n=1 Tax=Halorussus aquaticus TaxID=2953748 RepID=A0ABD5Q680_9EURY|nr:UbiA family prenyltransferase [Halorussus aquaticus]